tara:strand:- start:3026 stop:4027 length:1002 start_codon:yes stop_codon:yes gene_type:complete
MADLALRSPQFKHKEIPASGVLSTVCTVAIDGTLRYTLIKNVAPSTSVNFDISELARDYLEIEYKGNFHAQYVDVVTTLTNHAGLNGTAAVIGSATTFTDRGFESYGTFTENANPPITPTYPTFLISSNGNSIDTGDITVLAPTGKGVILPNVDIGGVLSALILSGSTNSTIWNGVTATVKRIDCTKYGDGKKVIFINKYGAQQELWFFLKNTNSLARTNEGYKSNTITYPTDNHATYSNKNAPNKVFNTQGKRTHKLSSGFYPEFANEFFEQLLLSEYVWMEIPLREYRRNNITTPVKVKTSSMAFKTSVNDRLIEYTIDFEEAYDYINNIR